MFKQLNKTNEVVMYAISKDIQNITDETISLFNLLKENIKCLQDVYEDENKQDENKQDKQQCEQDEHMYDEYEKFEQIPYTHPLISTIITTHDIVSMLENLVKNQQEHYYGLAMFALLNKHIKAKTIIELLKKKLIKYQWLGLYLSFNKNCSADDIIELIDTQTIHPYFALKMFAYNCPWDVVLLFETYHNKNIWYLDGISVQFGLSFLSNKPVKFINVVINMLTKRGYILDDLMKKDIRVYYNNNKELVRHEYVYKENRLLYKCTNDINEIDEYVKNFSNISHLMFVRCNKQLLNKIFEHDVALTQEYQLQQFMHNINILLNYLSLYWKYMILHKHNVCFTSDVDLVIPDMLSMNMNNNSLILVKYIYDKFIEETNGDDQ